MSEPVTGGRRFISPSAEYRRPNKVLTCRWSSSLRSRSLRKPVSSKERPRATNSLTDEGRHSRSFLMREVFWGVRRVVSPGKELPSSLTYRPAHGSRGVTL
jgi:hypothetical protein